MPAAQRRAAGSAPTAFRPRRVSNIARAMRKRTRRLRRAIDRHNVASCSRGSNHNLSRAARRAQKISERAMSQRRARCVAHRSSAATTMIKSHSSRHRRAARNIDSRRRSCARGQGRAKKMRKKFSLAREISVAEFWRIRTNIVHSSPAPGTQDRNQTTNAPQQAEVVRPNQACHLKEWLMVGLARGPQMF